MKEWKGTKGNFKEDLGIDLLGRDDELMQIIVFSKEVNTHNVAHVFGLSQYEVMANANLFVDVGNTIQKCGLLPSQILEERNELLGQLKELVEACGGFMGVRNAHKKSPLFKSNELINKIQNQ